MNSLNGAIYKVSIVIPLYNAKRYVAQTIESAIAQTYKNIEVIVVDDGSTDAPLEILARYPVHVFRQENKGASAARNTGIREATGDFIVMLDADDTIDREYVARTMSLMTPDVDVVCTDFEYFGENHSRTTITKPTLVEELTGNKLTCCALFRKQALVDVGGYNTKLFAYEDWNLWIDLISQGKNVVVLNEPLFHYRAKSTKENGLYAQAISRHQELVDILQSLHPTLYGPRSSSIVIPSKFPDIFNDCRDSVGVCLPNARKILVRDGTGITPPAGWTTLPGITPFNYSRNVNIGLSQSIGDVLVCNDDVRFLQADTLERMQDYLKKNPTVGIISPKIDGGVSNYLQHISSAKEGVSSFYLAFVCVMIRREVLDKVGMLDERYAGYGYDDVDYCRRVFNAGYKLAVTKDVTVKHGHGPHTASSSYAREFGKKQGQMQGVAGSLYKSKWGDSNLEWGTPTNNASAPVALSIPDRPAYVSGQHRYDKSGLVTNWWDRHPR